MQFEDLVSSTWSVKRMTFDFRLQAKGFFVGQAEFLAQSAGHTWVYQEEGTFNFGGRQYASQRRYHFLKIGSQIKVLFEDHRPFYCFDLNARSVIQFVHICGGDLYEGSMTLGPSSWDTEWKIVGAQKDILIKTSYLPPNEPAG